jgi:KDO2-lipid IV(A) lauroyltransferase
MAAKRRRPAVDYAVYLFARFAVAVTQALPWGLLLTLGDLVAWLAYHLDRRHREVAADNLRHAYPDKSPAEIDRLVRASYRHLVTVVIEMLRLPREINQRNVYEKLSFDPATYERARTYPACGRPLIIVTGHFGNWEALSYATAVAGHTCHVIARRLDNPYLDAYLKRFRAATGQTILDKNEDFDRIVAVLEAGGIVAALADQDAGRRGEFVTFFGRPASTHKSLALLSLRYDAILLVFGAARVGPELRFRVYLEDEIDPRGYADRPDAVRALTQRYTAALEAMARRHPEQYFWLHRRWKHEPPASRSAA